MSQITLSSKMCAMLYSVLYSNFNKEQAFAGAFFVSDYKFIIYNKSILKHSFFFFFRPDVTEHLDGAPNEIEEKKKRNNKMIAKYLRVMYLLCVLFMFFNNCSFEVVKILSSQNPLQSCLGLFYLMHYLWYLCFENYFKFTSMVFMGMYSEVLFFHEAVFYCVCISHSVHGKNTVYYTTPTFWFLHS